MSAGHRVTGRTSRLDLYGIPAWLIAEWCGVSLRTAKRWKAGRTMPEPARRLVRLHVDRRLLPDGWLYNERTGELVIADYDLTIPLDVLRAKLVVDLMCASPVREGRRRQTG